MKRSKKHTGAIKNIFLFALAVFSMASTFAQDSRGYKEIFGVSSSYESSRMINDRMFLIGNYTVGRRSFELGLSVGNNQFDSQGFLFQHKIFLNQKQEVDQDFDLKNHNLLFFAVYKFVMYGSSTNSLRQDHEIIRSDQITTNSMSSPTINTIEHYAGIGMEWNMFHNLYIEMMGVGGLNILKNNSEAIVINDKLLPKSNAKFSWDVSIGLNYRF